MKSEEAGSNSEPTPGGFEISEARTSWETPQPRVELQLHNLRYEMAENPAGRVGISVGVAAVSRSAAEMEL